jgi:excisionase family DNA binding protein
MTLAYTAKTRELLETRASLSVAEAAEILGISRSSTYNRVADGTIAHRRIGNRVVIPAAAIRDLLDQADNGQRTPAA